MFLRLLDVLAAERGREIWLEKTPKHLQYIDLIERATRPREGVKFVHIVRDGREVVASLHRTSRHWASPYSLEACVERWNQDLRITLQRVACSRDPVVFYEDLATDPGRVIRDLLARLDIPWNPEILTRYAATAEEITTPGEAWKTKASQPIELSRSFDRTFRDAERDYVMQSLETDLYTRLRRLTGES